MNWYKWSQNETGCDLEKQEIISIQDMLVDGNYRYEDDDYQNAFLKWSRCISRYYDFVPLEGFNVLDSTRSMSKKMLYLLSLICRRDLVLKNPETMSNISKWCGGAAIRFIEMSTPMVERVVNEQAKLDTLNPLRTHNWGQEVLFKLADRESLDRIFDLLKRQKFGHNFLVLGNLALGVMENTNAPTEFQDFIIEQLFKIKKKDRDGALYSDRDTSAMKTSLLKSLMINPNGSTNAIKTFLNGNIIHSNSEFLEIISDYRKSLFDELWSWKGVNNEGVNPNEEIMGIISEYINRIVDQWHGSMFDSMRRSPYDYKRMMEIIMWINVYSKNPEIIRKNYDTFVKATKIKRPEGQEGPEIPVMSNQGLIVGGGGVSRGLIATFMAKGSLLSEDELQNLLEILMFAHMENINTWETWANSSMAKNQSGEELLSPIAPTVLNTKHLKVRLGPLWDHFSKNTGLTAENILISLREGLKKFRFKDFIDKVKRDKSNFPELESTIGNFNVYKLRLRVVRLLSSKA